MIGREQISGRGHGVTNTCDGVGTGHTVIGALPVCETNGMYFYLSACAEHDPPIVHYPQTGDVESQLIEMELQPSVPLFNFPNVVKFIVCFFVSIIVWCLQLCL